MTYVTDAEKSRDIGDYRYFVTRLNQKVKVTRHLLNGKNLDPAAEAEDVLEEHVPSRLLPIIQELKSGKMPVMAA